MLVTCLQGESILVNQNLLEAVWKEQQKELQKLGATKADLQYAFTMVRTFLYLLSH